MIVISFTRAPRPPRPVARTGRPTDGGVRGMTLSAQIGLTARDARSRRSSSTCRPGELLALLGPNGAGKSTVLRCLAGLAPIDTGSIVIDGARRRRPGDRHARRAEDRPIGFVFQNYLLFDHMSVLENVAFGLRARKTPKADARRTAREWLDRVGLAEYADQRPRALSGGQAQRVALARALATSPRLLLLDEPLAALDVGTRASVRRDLRRHLETFDGMRLLVTHDPVDAYALADRVAILDAGRIVQVGHARRGHRPSAVALRRRPGRGQPGRRRRRRTVSSPPASGAHVVIADAVPGPSFAMIRPHSVALFAPHASRARVPATPGAAPSPTSTGSATASGRHRRRAPAHRRDHRRRARRPRRCGPATTSPRPSKRPTSRCTRHELRPPWARCDDGEIGTND